MIEKNKSTYNYFLFVLFLCVSGGQYFYIINGKYFVSLFLVLSFIKFVRNEKITKGRPLSFLLFASAYSLIHYYFLYPNHVGNTFLPQFMLLLGSYFFLSTLSFEEFKEKYVNCVSIMAIISIVIFLLVEFGFVSTTYVSKSGRGSEMFLFHNMGWNGLFGRLAGIYWEPGAYQIILNMTIILFMKEIINNQLNKKKIKQFIIIIIAMLLTQSTAGYMMFMLLVSYIVLKRNISGRFELKKILFVFICFLGCYYMYNSSTIQDKLAQEDTKGSSYEIRKADNLAMITMFYERPFIGYGLDSHERSMRNMALDNETSSNGIFSLLSTYGLIYFVVYIIFLMRGLGSQFSKVDTFFILCLFLFLNAFEVYWYFPLAFIFHFGFKESLNDY